MSTIQELQSFPPSKMIYETEKNQATAPEGLVALIIATPTSLVPGCCRGV